MSDMASASHSGSDTKAGSSNFIPSLDGLRAVSILIVFASHAGVSNLIPGGFGVTVFFFLSGFLITTLMIREFDRYGSVAFGAFYLRRALRLLPPLFITLVVSMTAVRAGFLDGDLDPATVFSQVFFIYNYYGLYGDGGSNVEGLSILWSLSVEEQFYLFFPALFVVNARGGISLSFIVALIAAIVIWRTVRVVGFGHEEWMVYISTDTRLDSLLYGCLLAILDWRGLSRRVFPQGPAAGLMIAFALIVLLVTFAVRDPVFRSTLRYTLQGIALMPLFHYAVTRPSMLPFRPLNWAPVRRLGVYSYTIYLVHFVVILGLERADFGAPGEPLFIATAAIVSVGYAALIYELAERPLKPFRARTTGHG